MCRKVVYVKLQLTVRLLNGQLLWIYTFMTIRGAGRMLGSVTFRLCPEGSWEEPIPEKGSGIEQEGRERCPALRRIPPRGTTEHC